MGEWKPTPPPVVELCRIIPSAPQKTCPPVSASGRALLSTTFFSVDFNVSFTVSAHPFMVRRCFSTARLRQQLVLSGPPGAMRARLQPTSSTFVDSRRLIPATPDQTARWLGRRAFCFRLTRLRGFQLLDKVGRSTSFVRMRGKRRKHMKSRC